MQFTDGRVVDAPRVAADHPDRMTFHLVPSSAAAFFVILALCSLFFALVEIHIEGGQGWAANLPTWRIENRYTRLFMGGRALTGYHLYVWLFIACAVHIPIAIDFAAFSWRVEARIIAFMILFWIVEDFLWFVFNPHFRLRRFRREHVPWHAPNWWWIMPRDYWVFFPIGVAIYLLSYATFSR